MIKNPRKVPDGVTKQVANYLTTAFHLCIRQ